MIIYIYSSCSSMFIIYRPYTKTCPKIIWLLDMDSYDLNKTDFYYYRHFWASCSPTSGKNYIKKKNFGYFILFMSSKYYNHWICEKPLGIKKQMLPYMQIASAKSQSVRIASHQPAFMGKYLVHEYVYYCLF